MQASCQCGSLTAEIDDNADPSVVMCHCIDCQKRSGSPFGTIAYYPRDKAAIAGEAREFTRGTDSGNTFTTGFCPQCGSTVYATTSRMPDLLGITTGTIADPAFSPPLRSVYEQSKHPWIALPGTMAHHQRGRDS